MMQKLKSRKFWVAIISIIVGILGVFGASDNVIQLVSSAGLILIPGIVYIVTEGKIDASAVSSVDVAELVETVKEYIDKKDETPTEEATNTEAAETTTAA